MDGYSQALDVAHDQALSWLDSLDERPVPLRRLSRR